MSAPHEGVLVCLSWAHGYEAFEDVNTWSNPRPTKFMLRRAVAQLVEQRSPKPQVAGSSPVRPASASMKCSGIV